MPCHPDGDPTELSEAGAAAGFQRIKIIATHLGVQLYSSFHYETVERFNITLPNGENMPVERMRKRPTHISRLGLRPKS